MLNRITCFGLLLLAVACADEEKIDVAVSSLQLKTGDIISCSPSDEALFGSVSFTASVPEKLKKDFNTAIALLHSFEYDESEKVFAKVIQQDPGCAMAYWGVAMSNFHPLWAPPGKEELDKGAKAIDIAKGIKDKTQRETDYIDAIGKFYEHADTMAHRTRVLNFEKAMEKVYSTYSDDMEAVIFYALALNAAADPTDKTYSRQKKALGLLMPLFEKDPLHPGLAHYIIHNSDYPALAEMALPAAKKYAAIAPASSHAQHMPSHIFTRLGLWNEMIASNKVAVSSAQCYAEQAKIKGHWDEELHGLDYLVYGYLQKGNDSVAKQQVNYLLSINEVSPSNFKTAYAFAAIPARYVLERKMWKEAANLQMHPANYTWDKFPWQRSLTYFTRVLGAVHTGDMTKAKTELENLKSAYTELSNQKDKAKEAYNVNVQVKAAEAWIQLKQGNKDSAVKAMKAAADLEDGTEKHPVTPGEIIPARELLAEMYLQLNEPALALEAFETNLQSHMNRFNSLYGAAVASGKTGNKEKAAAYYKKLLDISDANSRRTELVKAQAGSTVGISKSISE